MTATPRIYADSTKVTAERDNVALCSMDNAALYGQDLYDQLLGSGQARLTGGLQGAGIVD